MSAPPAQPEPPLPWPVTLVLLLGLLGGAVALALADERAAPDATQRVVSAKKTLIRDVLTGRRTFEDGRPMPPTEGRGSPGLPLRLAFVPSTDTAQGEAAVGPLLAFLRRRTGYEIEGAILRSYGLVVTSIIEDKCDVAFLTAASYARAHNLANNNTSEADDIEPILAAVRQGHPEYPGSDLAYRAAIIVRADSPIRSPAELDGRTVAMGPPTSGAGSILPSALFNELGIEPRVQRYGGYPFIVTAVLQGACEAGCVFWSPPNDDHPQNDARHLVESTHPEVFEETRIIGFTQWIPNEPVVVRSALPAEVKAVLRRAIALYVANKVSSPEGRAELTALGSVRGYIPATTADFDTLHEVIRGAFANDPEGLRDFMSGRR